MKSWYNYPYPMSGWKCEGETEVGQEERQKESARRRRGSSNTSETLSDGWKGFVNLELTEAQKPEAKKLMSDFARLWDNVISLVDAGYKMTLSYDDRHDAYNLSLTCRAPKDANSGYTLTGRGGSEAAAFASFWYKHEVILEGRWTDAPATNNGKMSADELS